MSLLTDFLKMFAPEDAEVVAKTIARIDEQDKWNDVFSTKLIELLDNIDGLKKEIRDRMRRVESVKFAESLLLDEAARTEALNAKLSETEKALEDLRLEFQKAKDQYQGAESLRKEASETFAEAASRYRDAKSLAEGASRDYKKAEEIGRSSANAYMESERHLLRSSRENQDAGKSLTEAAAILSSASRRLEQGEHIQVEANKMTLEAKRLLDQSIGRLSLARATEEKATADLQAARQDLLSSEERLKNAYDLVAVSERKRLEAATFFRKAARWTVCASATSLIGVAWMIWSIFRQVVPVRAPCLATAVFVLAAILVVNGVKREA